MSKSKSCFIISQIKDPGTKEREWADFLREHIVKPAVTACDYGEPKRADDPEFGLIMTSIIEQMFEADLVIADLTNHNPNVIYELGIRHCAQKPAIHLLITGGSNPFDLGENKVINVGTDHLVVTKAIEDIKSRINSIEVNPEQYHSEVQKFVQHKGLELLKQESGAKDKAIINVVQSLMKTAESQDAKLEEIIKLLPRYAPPVYAEDRGTALSDLLGLRARAVDYAPGGVSFSAGPRDVYVPGSGLGITPSGDNVPGVIDPGKDNLKEEKERE